MLTTRFAPSPTGFLHIGGLRTALYCYCLSRQNSNSKFIVRIEDTDLDRNSIRAKEAIIEAFKWTKLDYDELFFQSERFDIYKEYIARLLAEGKAYKCYMSREELDNLREEQIRNGERARYDSRYRDFQGSSDKPYVVRLKVNYSKEIHFYDEIKGDMRFNPNDILDDFIIARNNGIPTYNFVVVIDDILMKITHVLRGDDHLSNTPKQIAVYDALGVSYPIFAHIPMIHGENGKKLSKRDGATDVMDYKKEGYLPEALLNFLIRLGWSYKDQEIFTIEEMIKYFSLSSVSSSASIFSIDKLNWVNSQHIKSSSSSKLKTILEDDFKLNFSNLNKVDKWIELYRDRVSTLKELSELLKPIICGVSSYSDKAMSKHLKDKNIELLKEVYEEMSIKKHDSKDDIEAMISSIIKRNDVGYAKVAQPIRIALIGDINSPSISEIMTLFGSSETIFRIKDLLIKINKL